MAPAGICLVSLLVSPARCSQADAARAALPPCAARAAQPSMQIHPPIGSLINPGVRVSRAGAGKIPPRAAQAVRGETAGATAHTPRGDHLVAGVALIRTGTVSLES